MPDGSFFDRLAIRPATLEDAASIFAVHRDSVESLCRECYSSRQIEMWLEGRSPSTYHAAILGNQVVVATFANQVVGFLEFAPREIVKLFIGGAWAGKGIGDRLMHIGIARAEEGHNEPISIESTKNAALFYAKYGFHRVGEGTFTRGGSSVSIEVVNLVRERA